MDTQIRLLPLMETTSPTETASERLATEIIEAIDAIAARIPDLEMPHPSTARHVRGARTVSRAFMTSMVAAVEATSELEIVNTFNTEQARATFQFNDAFRPVADRLSALLKSLRFTMASRNARVAKAAMTTYAVAKGIARDPDSAPLAAHLENLRRALGRKTGRPRKRQA